MNREFKTSVLTAILVLGVGGAGLAAASPATDKPAVNPQKQTVVTSVKAKNLTEPKISQDQATQIAFKTHKNAKVDDIRLSGKVYTVHLSSDTGKYTLKIGANTGRVLKDKTVTASGGKTEVSGNKK